MMVATPRTSAGIAIARRTPAAHTVGVRRTCATLTHQHCAQRCLTLIVLFTGMWAKQMTVQDYQGDHRPPSPLYIFTRLMTCRTCLHADLIDLGWRRSGCYMYKVPAPVFGGGCSRQLGSLKGWGGGSVIRHEPSAHHPPPSASCPPLLMQFPQMRQV